MAELQRTGVIKPAWLRVDGQLARIAFDGRSRARKRRRHASMRAVAHPDPIATQRPLMQPLDGTTFQG
jgi:hypothetical protein